MTAVQVVGIEGIPEVQQGDDLSQHILAAVDKQGLSLETRDILVVTQKVVSKAEGRVVNLDDVSASQVAIQLSEGSHRDPRHTEVILRESRRIVRMDRGNIISETRHGFICANAGVDASNLPGTGTVAMLPVDPDCSARNIRQGILASTGKEVAVIISDTFGRPWREGAVNVAIGVSGMDAMVDYREKEDAYGQMMRTTIIAISDEIAGAAELVTGKTDGVPVALIRGYRYMEGDEGAGKLVRSPERDMFR